MSPVLLEALLLFVGIFVAGLLIGAQVERYRLAKWWHEQRLIPRPVSPRSLSPALPAPAPAPVPLSLSPPLSLPLSLSLSLPAPAPVPVPVLQLERPLPVRLEPVSGELVLFEGSRYEGEMLGLLRLEPTDGEGGG